MAIVQNPLIGQARQKLAGTVFQGWKGRNVLRSKPLQVGNPQTPAQVRQRNKLTLFMAMARAMVGVVLSGFKSQATSITEFNAFMSHALRNATTNGTAPAFTLDLDQVLISKGSIASTPIFATQGVTNNSTQVTIDWLVSSMPVGGASSDKALAAVIDANGIVLGSRTADTRVDEQTYVDTNRPIVTGETIFIYLGFAQSDLSNASDSVVAEETV